MQTKQNEPQTKLKKALVDASVGREVFVAYKTLLCRFAYSAFTMYGVE